MEHSLPNFLVDTLSRVSFPRTAEEGLSSRLLLNVEPTASRPWLPCLADAGPAERNLLSSLARRVSSILTKYKLEPSTDED